MLENTIFALNSAKRKITLIAKVFSIGVQILYLAYLVYCIVARLGNLPVNIALALIAAAYLVFDIVTRDKSEKSTKRTRKRVSGIYRRLKLVYGIFPILASVYGMYVASAADVKPLTIITTTIMIILWVVRAVVELLVYVITKEIDILKEAFLKDLGDIKTTISKPIDTVGSFVKGVAGKAPEDDSSRAARLGKLVHGFFSRKKPKVDEAPEVEEKTPALTDGK